MRNFPTGMKDVDREILAKLPDEDVIRSCSLNKYLREKVCDEGFFERRMREKYLELEIIIDEEYPFGTYSGKIYPTYKQAYLETIYYISKMKEIGYDYVRDGKPPRIQYTQAKTVYDIISKLKNLKYDHWERVVQLKNIINMLDLNLIKYAMNLYNFDTGTMINALANSRIVKQLDIIKYFAERGGAGRTMMQVALLNARQKGDLEMIKYFEDKLL